MSVDEPARQTHVGVAQRLITNVAALSLGQVGARALSVVYIAALARHVHPEGMGELATAQSLAAILAMCLGLGHDTLAVREIAARPSDATFWLWDLVALRATLSVFGLVALAIFGRVVGYSDDTIQVVVVYGVVMVIGTFLSVGRSILQAHELLALDAALQFGHDVLNIALSLAAIFLGASLLTIVWISVLANVVQMAAEFAVVAHLRLAGITRPSLSRSLRILRSGLGIGVVIVCSIFYTQAATILLSLLAGVAATGVYSAANNLLLVLLILPDMFQHAALPVFARLHSSQENRLGAAYQQSIRVLTAIGLPLAAGTFIVAEPAIALLYGPQYQAAVAPLRVLVFAVAATANYASAAVLLATGRQRILALTSLLELVAQVALGLVLIPSWGALGATVAYTLPRCITFVVYTGLCHRVLDLPLPFASFGRTILATGLMSGVVWSALQAGVGWLWLALLVGPAVYASAFVLLGGVDATEWQIVLRRLDPLGARLARFSRSG